MTTLSCSKISVSHGILWRVAFVKEQQFSFKSQIFKESSASSNKNLTLFLSSHSAVNKQNLKSNIVQKNCFWCL